MLLLLPLYSITICYRIAKLFFRDRKSKVESVIKRSNAISCSLEASASLSLLEATPQRLLRLTRRSVISAIKDAV